MEKSCAPNKVILRKIDVGNEDWKRSEAGIMTKNEAQKLEHKGSVLVVGSNIDYVKVGDVIHHGMHSGTVFACSSFDEKNEDEALVALNDYEILLVERK
jgi:co-chaperonin GroES (HSP10)